VAVRQIHKNLPSVFWQNFDAESVKTSLEVGERDASPVFEVEITKSVLENLESLFDV